VISKILTTAMVGIIMSNGAMAQVAPPTNVGQPYPAGWSHLYDPDGNYSTVVIGLNSLEAPSGVILNIPGDMNHPFEFPYCPVTATQTDPFVVDWDEFYGVTPLSPTTGQDFTYPGADPTPNPSYDPLADYFENEYDNATSNLASCLAGIDETTMTPVQAATAAATCAVTFSDAVNEGSNPGSGMGGMPFGLPTICDITWNPPAAPAWNPIPNTTPPAIWDGTNGDPDNIIQDHIDGISGAMGDLFDYMKSLFCGMAGPFGPTPANSAPDWTNVEKEYVTAWKTYDKKLKAINHNSWRMLNRDDVSTVEFFERQEWLIDQAALEFMLDMVDAAMAQYP